MPPHVASRDILGASPLFVISSMLLEAAEFAPTTSRLAQSVSHTSIFIFLPLESAAMNRHVLHARHGSETEKHMYFYTINALSDRIKMYRRPEAAAIHPCGIAMNKNPDGRGPRSGALVSYPAPGNIAFEQKRYSSFTESIPIDILDVLNVTNQSATSIDIPFNAS